MKTSLFEIHREALPMLFAALDGSFSGEFANPLNLIGGQHASRFIILKENYDNIADLPEAF